MTLRWASPARLFTGVVSLGLLAQGTSTLAALWLPALDAAMPGLLQQTQMVAPHSLLHIASGALGLATLATAGASWPRRFAFGFGLFYLALAFVGERFGAPLCLGLKTFDHPFHATLGALGLLAATLDTLIAHWAARRTA